jgi:CRISPR-associated protein Cas6
MRMFNPEWHAIQNFEKVSDFRDVHFDLLGKEIPADHAWPLQRALATLLPWLDDTPGAGIHPVHGAPSGRNENLMINRRVKLILRLPQARLADAARLCGMTIDLGTGPIGIGDMKEKPLTPYATLYAHFADLGSADEAEFLAAARGELEGLAIPAGLICGKQRKISTPTGITEGYSLMLHDLKLEHSLVIQERGLGRNRLYGAGIFIPHKSIKEVAID